MKICFFGIYDPTYSRNDILIAGLRQNGVEVIECREDWRDPKRYRKLRRRLYVLDNKYDFVYAAYPSPVPTILARIISRKPVITDAFYSMFDSVVNDRRKFSRWGRTAIKLLILDWLVVMSAHLVISDTEAHKIYWSKWWGIGKKKIRTVYLGVNDKLIHPAPTVKKDYILVHFHGYFIPLQGASKIVEAAHLCADDPRIRFRMIGHGRDLPKAKDVANRYNLRNIEFLDSVPFERLNGYMAEADIVLGIFGDTPKAQRVIPNKIYEGLAAKRAVISMDTRAVREIFTGKDILLVKNDAQSLANGIITLAADEHLRSNFASSGYESVLKFTPRNIGKMLIDVINASFK